MVNYLGFFDCLNKNHVLKLNNKCNDQISQKVILSTTEQILSIKKSKPKTFEISSKTRFLFETYSF